MYYYTDVYYGYNLSKNNRPKLDVDISDDLYYYLQDNGIIDIYGNEDTGCDGFITIEGGYIGEHAAFNDILVIVNRINNFQITEDMNNCMKNKIDEIISLIKNKKNDILSNNISVIDMQNCIVYFEKLKYYDPYIISLYRSS